MTSHYSMFAADVRSRSSQRVQKCHKCKFTLEEDRKLQELVKLHGDCDWALIAKLMGNRNPRQCRERWRNYMNPELCKEGWTPIEDQKLLEKYHEIGPHWNVISRHFPQRSINCVRNRLIKLLRTSSKNRSTMPRMPNACYSYPHPITPPPVLPMAFPTQGIPALFCFYGKADIPQVQTVWTVQTRPPSDSPSPEDPGPEKLEKVEMVDSAENVERDLPNELVDIFSNPIDEFGIEESYHF